MIKILKEEYDKRINSFLGEVETKAKYQKSESGDMPLIQSAKGLKVFNGAGDLFTVEDIRVLNGKTYVVLNVPGEADSDLTSIRQDKTIYSTEVDLTSSTLHENEVENIEEKEKSKNNKKEQDKDLRPFNKKADFKRQKVDNVSPNYKEINNGKQIIIDIETFEKDFTL